MIKLEKVNKYFYRHKKKEIHAINNTSLTLNETGLVSLLGPSGCGKTTLLNTIGGLDTVNSGLIIINNQKISSKVSRKVDRIRSINIGYIFQNYHLIEEMNVYDNIAIVLKMIGIKDKEEIKKRVNYVLESVGMYRYRKRLASMLSGGERQRVGIARAIVKNPSIIIADEPTGNLDSKNTIEIMNIIKSISKTKLVILVTHEKELAEFYSSRIIEIKDGVVISDKENIHDKDLDYRIDNKIYLKDFDNLSNINNKNYNINIYQNKNDSIDIDIVVKNNNIYVKSNINSKIDVIDNDSNVELINDHYHKLNKKDYESYEFDLNKLDNSKYNIHYSSILNIFKSIKNGFIRIINYSFIKKLLLLGFFVSAMFVFYSCSSIFGSLTINDEDFVRQNKNYLTISANTVKVDNYLKYEQSSNINYLLPGDSIVTFKIFYNYYYQTMSSYDNLSGSLASLKMITQNDITMGRIPQNEYEIVVDELTLNNMFDNNISKQVGITEYKQLLNKKFKINNLPEFTLVGIVDMKSPSIYVDESLFINIIANTVNEELDMGYGEIYDNKTAVDINTNMIQLLDYNLKLDSIKITQGRLPENDYEVIVNDTKKLIMPLNKKIDLKVNDQKLKVVGYYKSIINNNDYLVNNNTIKYNVITSNNTIMVAPKEKDIVLSEFEELNVNIKSSYDKARQKYVDSRHENINITLIVSGIILFISLIEIYLIVRASFLSRIKEVGILRAIGVKKHDIYKMFLGEILAITSTVSLLGVIFMYYVLNEISSIEYLNGMFLVNYRMFSYSILFIFTFNIFVGLLPVHRTIKKTPAYILSRNDVD